MFRLLLLCSIFFFNSAEAIVKQGLTNILNVQAGEEIPVKIQLTNFEDQPISYTLTPCDYTYQANGEAQYLDPSILPRSNASWIKLRNRSITVPSKGEANIFYDIKVPQDPSLSGSYWSLILIEPKDKISIQDEAKEGFNLILKIRYAYQIITNLPGGNSKLQLEEPQTATIEGKRLLCVDVKNIGTLFLHPISCLKLYDQQGKLVHHLQTQAQKILPACSVRYYFEMEGIKPGTYSGLMFFDDKQKNVFCHRVKVSIDE